MGLNGPIKLFEREFKINAVSLVTVKGKKASEFARNLGIHPNMLIGGGVSWLRSPSRLFQITGSTPVSPTHKFKA